MQGLVEHMQDIATQNPDKQKEMAKKLEEGKLSIRDWREQIQNVMNMYAYSPLPRCPAHARTRALGAPSPRSRP